MKGNFVETAFRHHRIVILICALFIVGGIYSLMTINKNEFPDFSMRQGIVAAAYPGATAEQVETEVTTALEDFIFTCKEVDKTRTVSMSMDGMSIVKVTLNASGVDPKTFWTEFKHKLKDFVPELPAGVLGTRVIDDFGSCSALLVAFESEDKTYPQLMHYVKDLENRLRPIESVGRMTVYGMQNERIGIHFDAERLAYYGLNDKIMATSLFTKELSTVSGRLQSSDLTQPIYVDRSVSNEYELQEMVIASDPINGSIRLKDVADVVREYADPESSITFNGTKCLLLSVEMKDGRDIVAMGHEVKAEIEQFKTEMPADIRMSDITDQTLVVEDSVNTFLHELLIAIIAVILVVVILLPIRTALVAASTIPVTVFISLSFFRLCGLELNTITLCLLIVTLGMIVDDAIVIIDAYLEKLGEIPVLTDEARKEASVWSARHYFKSVLTATLAITAVYYPVLFTVKGILKDFLHDFPLGMTIILFVSLIIAQVFVPFLQYWFIRKPPVKHSPFLTGTQKIYDRFITWCFNHVGITIGIGVANVALGIFLASLMPQRLIPDAERNQFAVEIYTPGGTSLEKTSMIADSLEHMLQGDPRIVSITSFKGCSSPRFQSTYSPHLGGTNFAQFIVNTTDSKTTVKLLDELEPKYADHFAEAYVRFKQINYSEKDYPVEVLLESDNLAHLRIAADSIRSIMMPMPELETPRADIGDMRPTAHISLHDAEASRLGINNTLLEINMAMRYSTGIQVASVWEDGTEIPVVLASSHEGDATIADLATEPVPTLAGLSNVPLRQVADIQTKWEENAIMHTGGRRSATVMSDFRRGLKGNGMTMARKISQEIRRHGENFLPADVKVSLKGDYDDFMYYMPGIIVTLLLAAVINFFIMLIHFSKVSTAVLLLCCFPLTILGTAAGVLLFGVDFGSTPVLGMVTLLGVLVRNCTIMLDYTEQLRQEGVPLREACMHSAKRRMRPILLTSTAAAVGVIPMIIGQNSLWMPMGVVIFVGTLCTMFFILTVIPAAYYMTNKRKADA